MRFGSQPTPETRPGLPKPRIRTYKEALELILYLTKQLGYRENEKPGLQNSAISDLDRFDKINDLDEQIKQLTKQRTDVLEDLVKYPPDFQVYSPEIAKLLQIIERKFEPKLETYRGSVFVMTKYSDKKNPKLDGELETIIDLVKTAIMKCGFQPLLANDNELHEGLWQNVECHMLACSHGVAIVESKYKPELNPNIAMEWGWMRARRKPVLYLIEKDVEVLPADVTGLIQSRFDWLNPQADIPTLVTNYFRLD
jgi:hypothetical protein